MNDNGSYLRNTAYAWKSLPQDALVVDVGGGVGSVSLTLAREHKNMKIVIQDKPAVVQAGIKVRHTSLDILELTYTTVALGK